MLAGLIFSANNKVYGDKCIDNLINLGKINLAAMPSLSCSVGCNLPLPPTISIGGANLFIAPLQDRVFNCSSNKQG